MSELIEFKKIIRLPSSHFNETIDVTNHKIAQYEGLEAKTMQERIEELNRCVKLGRPYKIEYYDWSTK